MTLVAFAGGGYHNLALSSNGQVFAWGYNNAGQLGEAQPPSANAPVAVTMTGAPRRQDRHRPRRSR